MKNKQERLNQILLLLQKRHSISVSELSQLLHVSDMTIRRDLDYLQNNSLVTRGHGMAYYKANSSEEDILLSENNYDLSEEKIRMNPEKERIGRFAVTLLEPDDNIIIDTGSTTDYFARLIPDTIDMTVLCYNYNILAHIINKPNIHIIFPGGYFHSNGQFFESPQSINLIENFRANKMFVSASGIHENLGITCANNYEVNTKRTALRSSQIKILLTDSTKFNMIRSSYFADLKDIDVIVTDTNLSQEWKALIKECNITLHLV